MSVVVWHNQPVAVDNDDDVVLLAKLYVFIDVDAIAVFVPLCIWNIVLDVDGLGALRVPLHNLAVATVCHNFDIDFVAPP